MKHLNKENENKTIVNFVSSGERKFNTLKKIIQYYINIITLPKEAFAIRLFQIVTIVELAHKSRLN